MKRGLFVVVSVLLAVMMMPGLALATPKVTESQIYTWGGFTATTFGPHINGLFDTSLKVYKNNATVYQLTPSDWSTWYGWRAERFLLMGRGATVTWGVRSAPADEMFQDPRFLYWVCGGRHMFTAKMVQDKFDPMSYEVTEVIFQ